MDGFSQRGIYNGRKIAAREFADLFVLGLKLCLHLRFFPDYHAMRRFFALPRGLYANAVHHICLFPNKHTFNKVFAHHDFLYVDLGHPVKFNVKKCGAVHFPSKCNTISTTNPPSTHAVDLAPNADHTYPAGALGHQSD